MGCGGDVVIVIEGGAVRDVYSDNSNIQAVIVDLDNKKLGEEYIFNFCWPEIQFDDEEIKELMRRQYENYFGEES